MRILSIEHEPDAGAGVFAPVIAERADLEIWTPADNPAPALDGVSGVICFGGSMNADQGEEYPWMRGEIELLRELLEAGVPTVGVCLGSQLLGQAAGAPSRPAPESEIGFLEVTLTEDGRSDPLLSAMPGTFEAFQWHSYEAPLPSGARALATSPVCVQAHRCGERAWGIQFHAEVSTQDALAWTAHHDDDPAFAALGLEPEPFAADIRDRMPAWNELGVRLCERFLEIAGAA